MVHYFNQTLVTCCLVSALIHAKALPTGAASASVSVVLIDAGGESPARVYGAVRAYQGGSVETSLFQRSARESVGVNPTESIPLTRKVVSVEVAGPPLTVTVDLWDHHVSWSDYPIGQGSVDLLVKVGTTQKRDVVGIYGQVQVSVTCW